MTDRVLEKRAEASERRLEELSVYETAEIDEITHYRTARFERPDDLPPDSFEPCEVGFTWKRNRKTTPEDRRRADVDVTTVTDLPDELAVGENVWFRLRFSIPDSMAGRPVSLRFAAEPVRGPDVGLGTPRVECLCYRDGEPWQAFDDGHTTLLLTEEAVGGETFDLLVEAGTTTLWGQLDVDEFALVRAELEATRPAVRDLARNYAVLNELRREIPDDSLNVGKILRGLAEASYAFAFEATSEAEYEQSARDALSYLDALKAALRSDLTGYELTAVGHAHIDLAWLWPWSETVRKGARSFSNVLKLMDEYPDFAFLQSQPHLYELIRNRYPTVFEGIADRIADGSWQPTGALWVESDVNVAGGEALCRQFLYGKRYFRNEFGVDPTVAFLPDVFGYCAALPTIARAADCPYFFTQKMSWNEHNDFPYSSFVWEGLDGSTVLSHFPPADTYNGDMSIAQIRRSVTNHRENDLLDESVYLFGWGDGGGGPTREMLERRAIVDEIGSLPNVSMGSLDGFFEQLSAHEDDLPRWVGELYLEKHQGTLTTQARTKRNNRKAEFALREAECWASLAAATVEGFEYPHEQLERAWKILLFNQFHDILPGSSVADVYVDADREYVQVFEATTAVTTRALDALVGSRAGSSTDTTADSNADSNSPSNSSFVCVTNSFSWERDVTVEVDASDLAIEIDETVGAVAADGMAVPVQPINRDGDPAVLALVPDVPAFGATTVEFEAGRSAEAGGDMDPVDDESDPNPAADELSVSPSHIANARIRLDLHDDGTVSAHDLEVDRPLFDGVGNRLVCYRDQPAEFEAWDVEGDLYEVGKQLPAPEETTVVESGPVRATVEQRRTFGDSTLVQRLSLECGSKRIEVETRADWQEEERFLRAHVPVDVYASEATYDVQFGHVTRNTHENTSWDVARYEEAHHHWVDVGEPGYGVAVLNDCKYGVHVDGSDVSLGLLRAPNDPDPEADRGEHRFRYTILPHEGDFRDAGVIEAGYDVNAPTTTIPVDEPVSWSPIGVAGPGIVVEAVKRAEDDDRALVCRLYEAWGRRTDAQLSFDLPVVSVAETNLLEEHRRDVPLDDGEISLDFDAFELKTLLFELE